MKRKINKRKRNKSRKARKPSIRSKHSMKKGGGCGCKDLATIKMSGGADFFNHHNIEPVSFSGVPIRDYYSYNKYDVGTDVQGAQISSRSLPNFTGGRKIKYRKTRKIRGGLAFSNYTGDPMLSNNTDIVSQNGNMNGSLLSANILRGVPSGNYGSLNASIDNNPLV